MYRLKVTSTEKQFIREWVNARNSIPGIFYESNLMQGKIVIILLAYVALE